MLRITPSSSPAAAQDYYLSALVREDYYARDQELVGKWRGAAAELMGVAGLDVQFGQFAALTENRHPVTGERLTPRSRADRVCCWDLNFHAPKSFSLLRALGNEAENLTRIFQEAVTETMQEIERLAMTRIRRGGKQDDRLTSNIIYADFLHGTARPVDGVPDPHCHMHCVVMNATFDVEEQRWKALKIHDIKKQAPYFQAFFNAKLSSKTEQLGYPVARTAKAWEVAELNNAPLLKKFSQRTEQIEKIAKEKGITNAKAKDALGARTRAGKRKGLSGAELHKEWNSRLTAEERQMLQRALGKQPRQSPAPRVTPAAALDFAEEKLFQRDSIVSRSNLLAEALRFGVGQVLPEDLEKAARRRGYVEKAVGNDLMLTTRGVLREEIELIQRVRSGRASMAPLFPGRIEFSREFLAEEQREAIRHILRSSDQVVALRGLAGTGKTTTLEELREIISRDLGTRIFAFAPSADASRGELRKSGFRDADTVARLLSDKELQLKVRGKILLLDEAGMLSIPDMARFMAIAGKSTKVILSGDTGQHGPVNRGPALKILEEYADVSLSTLKDIRRQENLTYRDAVKALSRGDIATGFALLDRINAIVDVPNDAARYRQIADEYFQHIKEKGAAPLVVSPTHAEGREVTQAIRQGLAERGKLGAERTFLQYRPLKWTEAEKKLPENYSSGLMLQFHQHATGIKRGSILPVVEVDAARNVWLGLPNGARVALDWKHTDRFEVFEAGAISLAKGDLVRITKNGPSFNGRRLFNGTVFGVEKIGRDGKLTLSNGAVLSPDHGHLEYGYVRTSHAVQGKTDRTVFVAQSSNSGLAGNMQQIYVSVSRGKESIRIFTDDRKALQEMAGVSAHRGSALEFAGIDRDTFMKVGGDELLKRFAAERAKRVEGRTHAEKLLVSRGMNVLKKPEGMGFVEYVQIRRDNAGPDGRSRSKGQGPSKATKKVRGYTLPKTVEMREDVKARVLKPKPEAKEEKPKKEKKAQAAKPEETAKTKAGQKIDSVKKRLKTSLEKALPEKSVKVGSKRSVKIGKTEVKLDSLNGAGAKKSQELKHEKQRKQRRVKQLEKKAPAKVQAPVIRRK